MFGKCEFDRNYFLSEIRAELLLGDRNYGPPIDLWAAGCIMAEMWTRFPIMQGKTEQQQITIISELCGSITPDVCVCFIFPSVCRFYYLLFDDPLFVVYRFGPV